MSTKKKSRVTPARLFAQQLGREVRERDAYLRELIDSKRAETELEEKDFAYAQVLSFGVVMCRGTLDECIDRNLNSPRDIKAKVRDCLRISVYELLFLNKRDDVVVNQGVELVRAVAPKASGLANAVLRKIVADAKNFPWGDVEHDTAALARSMGMPVWMTELLISRFGLKTATEVLSACLHPAPTYTLGLEAPATGTIASDLAAQYAASLIPVGEPILEIGAGRGTKTLLIQSRSLRNTGGFTEMDSVDVHKFKSDLLEKRMREHGVEKVRSFTGDACDLASIEGLREKYSAILVDVPCSGLGTLRRHPEIRWNIKPADLNSLAELQSNMLVSAASKLSVGGTLVYATCTLCVEENENVVKAFLSSEAGECFEVKHIDGLPVRPQWSVTSEGFFQSLPVEGGPDGHFAALLTRVK